jgi:ADP-ribosyl-[dinitrogen reductase] hydrolase
MEEQAMHDNRSLLSDLLRTEQLQLAHGLLLDSCPPPLPDDLDWGRVEGMLLGLAIGDALGNTTESRTPADRERNYGEIRDYLPNRYAGWHPLGVPSDDTQLAYWTLEQLLADRGLEVEHLAARFCAQQIYGIGSAVSEFVASYRRGVRPWWSCAARSAGNGALMRIAPLLIPHLRRPSSALWADVALAASVTHNDATSTAACLAWTSILWRLLGRSATPEALWWPRAFIAVARELEGETVLAPRSCSYQDYRGPLWRFVAERLPDAYERRLSVRQACDGWYSGAYLLETVPCVLYILMCHGHDPEEALVRAVNDTKDNDSIAAIVGCAVGALHGVASLPERWLRGLTGRTAADDDGRIQTLLALARRAFGPPA